MRFKTTDIGMLVRPKTITQLFLWDKTKNINEWWNSVNYEYRWRKYDKKKQLINLYNKPLDDIFKDLSLGNFKTNTNSYVAQITSFIIYYNGSLFFVDNYDDALYYEKEIRKRFGTIVYLPVISVGLKFYKNVSFNKNKELKPEMPCDFSHNNEIWFYLPKDIIPLTNIINFENIKISKLVTTKNSKGIVVSIKKNNNKNFYSKNSSVSKIITLLTTSLNYVNLMPDKKFKIID